MVTDEIRYDAYVLCRACNKETIEKELELIKKKTPRRPRDGYCQNDILITVDEDTIQYALTYYDFIKNLKFDSWQNYFEYLQEIEHRIL